MTDDELKLAIIEVRIEAGDLWGWYQADADEDVDDLYCPSLDQLQAKIQRICAVPERTWADLPRADRPMLTRINQTIAWAEHAYELVTGSPWTELPPEAESDEVRTFRTHPRWTHGIGRDVRLFIRDNPGWKAEEIQGHPKFKGRTGAGRIHFYLVHLSKGRLLPFSAYTPGKGYYMSEEAYLQAPDDDNSDHRYQQWLKRQKFPPGYED